MKRMVGMFVAVIMLMAVRSAYGGVTHYDFEAYNSGDLLIEFILGDQPWGISIDPLRPEGQQKVYGPTAVADYSDNSVSIAHASLSSVYTYEAKIRPYSAQWAGMVFDYADSGHYYYFRINAKGGGGKPGSIHLLRRNSAKIGDWGVLGSVTYKAFDTNLYYALKITRDRSDGMITAYVNGEKVMMATDNTYIKGNIGLRDEGKKARYDDISLVTSEGLEQQKGASSKHPAILFVCTEYPNTNPMRFDDRVKKELQTQGYEIGWTRNWSDLTPKFLRQFNAVICYTFPRVASEQTQKQMDILRQYVNDGGSVFVTGQAEQEPGRYGLVLQNLFLAPVGGEVLYEQVNDEKNRHYIKGGNESTSPYEFCWTNQISKDHLTEGVSGLWYPGRGICGGSAWTNPIKVDENWKILVKGMPSTKSWITKWDTRSFASEGSYKESPPLAAVREYGKGRIVIWPLHFGFTFVDGYHPLLEDGIVMDGDVEGKKSQGGKLTYNLLKWLAEPSFTSGTMGGYVRKVSIPHSDIGLSRVDWSSLPPMEIPFKNAYLGLVGAQTNLSSGKGTPEEFIDAAKKAGYQFIAFTEDLATLTKDGWDKLADICRKNTNANFDAIPGLYVVDSFDSAFVVFGNIDYPPDSWRAPNDPQKRIKWANCFARGYAVVPPIAVVKIHSNGRPPRFQAMHHGFAIYTYENGKLVDDALSDYLNCQKEGLVLFPLAVHLVKSPEEVLTARVTGFQTYIRANSLEKILESIDDWGGSRGRVYKPSFVSSGPEIQQLYAQRWGTKDLAVQDNDRHRVQIAVKSDVGLAEVEVLDNGKVIRRFLPDGKEFKTEFDNFHDRQHDYVLRVTDKKGGIAISWNRETQVQECWFGMCSDNWNDLGRGKWFEEKIQPLRGVESYLPPAADVLQKWPVIEGHQPGKAPETVGNLATMKQNILTSRYGWVVDYSLDNVYSSGGCPGGIYDRKILPNPNITGTLRETFFCRRAGEVDLRLIEGTIKVRRDIETDGDFPVRFFNSQNAGAPDKFDHLAWIDDTGRLITEAPAPAEVKLKNWSRKVSLKSGEYTAFFPDLVAVFPLEGGYSAYLSRSPESTSMYLGPVKQPQLLKAGTEFKFKYAFMLGTRWAKSGLNEAEDVRVKMGLAGSPAYKVTPKIGSVESTQLVLKLNAENYGWRGTITQAHLPFNLPASISGLNERWSSGIWYKGTNRLFVPEWPKYDEFGFGSWVEKEFQKWRERTDEIQRFGIVGDVGYLQVDTEGGDRDVFIGNLLVCDNPEMWLTLIRDPGRAYFVAHNPTDTTIQCRVRPGPGFDLLGAFDKHITVTAGSSVTVEL